MTYLSIEAKKCSSNSFDIPFDRQELADYLEVDRSGLSTEIGKLKSEGVIEIAPSVGNKFDHNVHSAVESIVTEDEKLVGTIQAVRLNGYKLKDRLIRPATVVVYVKKVEKEENINEVNEEIDTDTVNETVGNA